MTDIMCSYAGNRDEVLVAYVYDEISAADRAEFDAHLRTCARCRTELAALGGVRQQLARWNPPEPRATITPQLITAHSQWWRQIPAWAQVAAAVLVLGASAGLANLNIRYDSTGVSVRTGWMPAATTAVSTKDAAANATPWRVELAALEERLRSEVRNPQPSSAASAVSASDVDIMRRVRALVDESEKRGQRELRTRLVEVLRDVEAQRVADLSNIDRNFGVIQNNAVTVQQRQRDLQNYLLHRVSQQK